MKSGRKSLRKNREKHSVLVRGWLGSYESENTRAAYQADVLLFLAYLDKRGTDLLRVSVADIDAYARLREQSGESAATAARRVAAVASLYRFAVADGLLRASPAERVRRPEAPRDGGPAAALTRYEAEDLLDLARMHSARAGAMVNLLLTSGLRISEALGARASGVLSDRMVVERQGGATSVIRLPDHTVAALRSLMETPAAANVGASETDALLFTTRSGRQWDRTDVSKLLRRLGQLVGIRQPVTPRVIRHTHAALALEIGVPLHHLQDSLGHKDPRAMQKYDQVRSRRDDSPALKVGALFG